MLWARLNTDISPNLCQRIHEDIQLTKELESEDGEISERKYLGINSISTLFEQEAYEDTGINLATGMQLGAQWVA